MTPFQLALLSLVRRKVPTAIALIAIAVSVAFSGMLLRVHLLSSSRFSSLGAGGDAIIGAKAGGLEILLGSLNGEGDYPGFLPMNLFQTLRQPIKKVFEDGQIIDLAEHRFARSVIPLLYFGKSGNFRAIGTDESFLQRPESRDSLVLQEGHWPSGSNEVVLGAIVAQRTNIKIAHDIPIQPWLNNETLSPRLFRVAGILRETNTAWDRLIYSDLSQAQQTLSAFPLGSRALWKNEVLNYILVYSESEKLPELASLINQRTVGQMIYTAREKERLEELTGSGKRLGLLITAFVILLGGLTVAAMLTTRFEAMSVQLAVFVAIGYTRVEVAAWLLWEGLLLGILACALGAMADLFLFPELRGMLKGSLPPPELFPSSILYSAPVWLAALLANVVAILIPLYRLFRQEIHSSLRGL